jgi:hypothetical protein
MDFRVSKLYTIVNLHLFSEAWTEEEVRRLQNLCYIAVTLGFR